MSEINIMIIDREGKKHTISAPTNMGMSLMEIIQSYEIAPPGTIGICGGIAMCASCHCYINSKQKKQNISPDEEAMLSETLKVNENSRLSCQIPITKELEGLEIQIVQE